MPVEFLHPEVEWRTPIESYRGRDGVLEWQRDLREAVGDFAITVEEIVAVADRVLVVAAISGRAAMTGVEGEVRLASLFTVADGSITRLDSYLNREEAVRAAEA